MEKIKIWERGLYPPKNQNNKKKAFLGLVGEAGMDQKDAGTGGFPRELFFQAEPSKNTQSNKIFVYKQRGFVPISQVWPGGNSKLPEEEQLHDVSSLVKFPEAWYVSNRIDHKCSRVA